MDRTPSEVGEGQLALPFTPQPARSPQPDDVTTWPGWQALDDSAWIGRLPGTASRVVGRGIVRWSLRLVLPLICAAAVLHSFPYHATVEGVPFRVQGTILHRPGLSADTTVGNWEFPALDGLPFGVHVTPENVDLLQLTRAANADTAGYVRQLQDGFTDQSPRIVRWLLGETVLGLLLGLAAAAAINMAVRYLRGIPRRRDEFSHRGRQLAAAAVAALLVAGYGLVSFNRDWVRRSRLTGTLAAAQLFPDQLRAYYQQQSKAFDVLGSVIGIQAALQAQIEQRDTPQTAFQVMFISDVHLAAAYPLVAQYAKNYDVRLIVNTGDESEFGTRAELTSTYVDAITAITHTTPMLWLAGNHDSPEVEDAMRAIPGVTVLGRKTATAEGFAVSAGTVQAFGLTIAGLPDPRVYGASGAYGADVDKATDPLERSAVDDSVRTARSDGQRFDIFATHEPVAAAQLRAALPSQIRQTNAGHTHQQNDAKDVQRGSSIDLVEGSTGAGGLDNIVRGGGRPPIEFSIESVATDCQFTRILRFQIRSPQTPDASTPQAYGNDVTVSTNYFRPQNVDAARTCSTDLGLGPARPL